jgi:hypothetical protein
VEYRQLVIVVGYGWAVRVISPMARGCTIEPDVTALQAGPDTRVQPAAHGPLKMGTARLPPYYGILRATASIGLRYVVLLVGSLPRFRGFVRIQRRFTIGRDVGQPVESDLWVESTPSTPYCEFRRSIGGASARSSA